MNLSAVLNVEVNFAGPTSGDWLRLDDENVGIIGTNTLAPEQSWTDITQYVYGLAISRGARRLDGPVAKYEAGTATIRLDNHDRRFDPTNLDGPYVSAGRTEVEPMREMRIAASYLLSDGTWIHSEMFHGYVDSWDVTYEQLDSEVTLTCTDGFKVIGNHLRSPVQAAGENELTGERINRILDSADWPVSLRRVDDGLTRLLPTDLEGSALDEALVVCEAEIGELYVDGGGYVVFRNRNALAVDDRSSTSQAIFGDQATGAIWSPPRNENPDFAGGTDGYVTSDAGGLHVVDQGVVLSPLDDAHSSVYVELAEPVPVLRGATYKVSASLKMNSTRTNGLQVSMIWDTGVSQVLTFTGSTGDFETTELESIAPDGATELQARISMLNNPDSGDNLSIAEFQVLELSRELEYSDVTMQYDETTMFNHFRVTREGEGAVEQIVELDDLIARYLRFTYEVSGLPLTSDEEALQYARYISRLGSEPELRFAELKLDPQGSSEFEDRLYPQVFGREIGDRITIRRRPPGGGDPIEREVFIRGIVHTIEATGTWETTWSLQAADKHAFFVIGDDTLGRLDYNILGL